MSAASLTPGLTASSPMFTASGKDMRKSGRQHGKVFLCDGRTLRERVSSFLRAQHPDKTAAYVACEIGVPAETVRKWLEQGSVPNGAAMLALVRRYRMSFIDEVLGEDADDWIADLARQEQQERLRSEAAAINHRLALVMQGRTR